MVLRGAASGRPLVLFALSAYAGRQAGDGRCLSVARLPPPPTATTRTSEQWPAPTANATTNDPLREARSLRVLFVAETVAVTRTRSCARKCEPAMRRGTIWANRSDGRLDEPAPVPTPDSTRATAAA